VEDEQFPFRDSQPKLSPWHEAGADPEHHESPYQLNNQTKEADP